MSYEAEMREEERAIRQEQRSPRPVGDRLTADDFVEWVKQTYRRNDERNRTSNE